MNEEIREKIFGFVSSASYVPQTSKALAELICTESGFDIDKIYSVLAHMLDRYELYLTKKGRVILPEEAGIYKGVFSSAARGEFGFVNTEFKEYFIPPKFICGALNGDAVIIKEIEINSKYAGKGNEAEVLFVTGRANNLLCGTFKTVVSDKRNKEAVVVPDSDRLHLTVKILQENFSSASDGDKVICKIIKYPEMQGMQALGKITEVLGRADSQEANYKAILRKNEIITEFSENAVNEAKEMCLEKPTPCARFDLRSENIFTIDGADAKDLDDAISIKMTKNGYILGVHISDVSHYVCENSSLDKEAMARGTSVYFTDKVVPMLPPQLSNGICSLNAGVDRYTLSAIITLDKYGNIENTEIKRTIINSKVRGVYSELNDITEKGEESAYYEKYRHVTDDFFKMLELYRILKAKSVRRGAIELESDEIKIILDENGHPTEILKCERGESEKLIEQFMLCANEAVASYLINASAPCVFRVHEEPDKEKINAFAVFARNLGVDTSPMHTKNAITPSRISAVLENAKGTGYYGIVSSVLLRSLMKAKYSSVPKFHFGLATERYCHFTSPIRRYPDLSVHRIINAILDGKTDGHTMAKYEAFAAVSASESSKNEIRAIYAEREIEDLYKCVYLSDRIGNEYDATICSVTSFGFFARTENLCEGLVPVFSLNGRFWFDERNYMLSSGKRSYRLGDSVRVRVREADIITRRVTFELCSNGTESETKNINDDNTAKGSGKNRSFAKEKRRDKKGAVPKTRTTSKKGKKTKKYIPKKFHS